MSSAVEATIERFGRLDILVNNAATNPYAGPIMDVDEGRYDKTFQVNVKGPIFWSQAAWRQWMKDNGGVIINIASVGGLRSEGLLGIYNLTKAALIHLTRQLGRRARAEGAGRRHRSRPREDRLRADARRQLRRQRSPARLPTRRLGEPEDIAHLATFLASDLASWITGETYVIDGGAGVAHNRGAPPRASSRQTSADEDLPELGVALRVRAPVDLEQVAGDPRRIVGREEEGDTGDVVGRAGATERRVLDERGLDRRRLVQERGEGRVDEPRADRVDPDAVRAELHRRAASCTCRRPPWWRSTGPCPPRAGSR